MARTTRKSEILETARQRLAGLKQLSPQPNFGPALTVEAYETEINGFSNDRDTLNGELAALSDKVSRLAVRERALSQLNQRILAAVKAHFGPDSSEFSQLGGTRTSDRKKPVRARKPTEPGQPKAPENGQPKAA
jgi:hypothetical protein